MEIKRAQEILEAVLFSFGEPVEIERLAVVIEQDVETTRKLLDDMMLKYQAEDRGIQLLELDRTYQFCTKKEMYEYLIKLTKAPKKAALTEVQLETLAIVAYRQPITRMEIEAVRGVKSDYAVNRLIELKLIEEKGRRDTPGKPIMFGTTDEFLRRFGLRNMDELPVPERTYNKDNEEQQELDLQI